MMTAHYQLAEDVHFCLADNRIVFLDLRRNQYLCLNQRNTLAAMCLLSNATGQHLRPHGEKCATDCATDNESVQLIVHTLKTRGLLTERDMTGKEPYALRIQRPENSMLPERSRPNLTVRHHHRARFIAASLTASWKLRWYSMQQTVASVQHRNRRRPLPRITEFEDLRELVAIFHRLRPYYVRKYLCLYDSLALLEFLAHYHLSPRWVFGVVSEPFNAHCWVQEQDCVLNDAVEYVRGFTPIMVV